MKKRLLKLGTLRRAQGFLPQKSRESDESTFACSHRLGKGPVRQGRLYPPKSQGGRRFALVCDPPPPRVRVAYHAACPFGSGRTACLAAGGAGPAVSSEGSVSACVRDRHPKGQDPHSACGIFGTRRAGRESGSRPSPFLKTIPSFPMRETRLGWAWCGRPDSNRHSDFSPRDFHTSYGFRRLADAVLHVGSFVVWTIPSP